MSSILVNGLVLVVLFALGWFGGRGWRAHALAAERERKNRVDGGPFAPELDGPSAGGTQADDEKNLGRIAYEARMAYRKEKGTWDRLSVAAQLAEKAGAQAVLDATEPTVGIPRTEPKLCACGHFEVMHSLETPYPCQFGYVPDVKDGKGTVVKRGRPATCGCKGYTFDEPPAAGPVAVKTERAS